jgi:hypothetical protein
VRARNALAIGGERDRALAFVLQLAQVARPVEVN